MKKTNTLNKSIKVNKQDRSNSRAWPRKRKNEDSEEQNKNSGKKSKTDSKKTQNKINPETRHHLPVAHKLVSRNAKRWVLALHGLGQQ